MDVMFGAGDGAEDRSMRSDANALLKEYLSERELLTSERIEELVTQSDNESSIRVIIDLDDMRRTKPSYGRLVNVLLYDAENILPILNKALQEHVDEVLGRPENIKLLLNASKSLTWSLGFKGSFAANHVCYLSHCMPYLCLSLCLLPHR